MGKTMGKLASIVLAGAMTLGMGGCHQNPEYHFEGKIGDEIISFKEPYLDGVNILKVQKRDIVHLIYVDRTHDFQLDDLSIIVGANTTVYNASSDNPVVQEVLKKAQLEFEWYLQKIIEIQTAPLYDRQTTSPKPEKEG